MRIVLLILFGISSLTQAQEVTIDSEYLQQTRVVTVLLPESYESSVGDYPTLYVFDGQWYGHLVTTTVREANRFIPLLPDFIVVAINNNERWQDFTEKTTQPNDSSMYQGPYLADGFRNFIKGELIPKIEAEFRVSNHRVAFGYSLGGGFLAETLYKDASLFSNYILISPYLRWNGDASLRNLDEVVNRLKSQQIGIALAIGSDEDDDTREPAIKFYEGVKNSQLIYFNDYLGENHTSMPNAALFKSLRTLYSHWFPDRATGTLMSGEQHLNYFARQHQKYIGTEKVQTSVFDFLFTWFGYDDENLELLCEAYEKSYKVHAKQCAKGL